MTDRPPYRYVAAVYLAAGFLLAGVGRYLRPDLADFAIMAALALMFYAGRNWQRGAR